MACNCGHPNFSMVQSALDYQNVLPEEDIKDNEYVVPFLTPATCCYLLILHYKSIPISEEMTLKNWETCVAMTESYLDPIQKAFIVRFYFVNSFRSTIILVLRQRSILFILW